MNLGLHSITNGHQNGTRFLSLCQDKVASRRERDVKVCATLKSDENPGGREGEGERPQ